MQAASIPTSSELLPPFLASHILPTQMALSGGISTHWLEVLLLEELVGRSQRLAIPGQESHDHAQTYINSPLQWS